MSRAIAAGHVGPMVGLVMRAVENKEGANVISGEMMPGTAVGVIRAGNKDALAGTADAAEAISAVGQKEIPPPEIPGIPGRPVIRAPAPGAKLGVGASIAAGKAPALAGTAGTEAMKALGHNEGPGTPGANEVISAPGANDGSGAVTEAMRAVSPGAKPPVGAVMSAPGAIPGIAAVIKGDTVPVVGDVMTA